MLNLQKDGAHNINLVTPTHLIAQILNALLTAYRTGLSIPVVYNTSGYEKPEIIESLEGIVDIYLPDIKYISASLAKKYSQAADYSFYSQESIKVMYQQKPLAKWQENVLLEGLIVRHLLLPGYTKETRKILFWLNEFTPQALLSIMFQYQPYYRAKDYPELNRKIKVSEYKEIKRFLADLGIRGWVQSLNSQENLAGVYFKPDAE
jgi:putative pyruvate formate lyase activating enzyme